MIDQPTDVVNHAIHFLADAILDSEADFVNRELIVSPQFPHLRFYLSAEIDDCRFHI